MFFFFVRRKNVYLIFIIIIVISINIYLLKLLNFNRSNNRTEVRVCCLVLTLPKYFSTRARAVYETWGSKCDKLLFISESSNISTDLPIASIDNLIAGYEYLSSKSFLAFKYIYENDFQHFNWFLKTDDDTFIIMENLKDFLKDKNPLLPITYGYNYRVGYQSGGSGYVLSKESVRRLNEGIQENNLNCQIFSNKSEDMHIGDCLMNKGISQGDSTDEFNRQRFHPLPFIDHWNGNFPQWFKDFSQDRQLKKGSDCCSEKSIAFHYVSPDMMYTINAFIYKFKLN